MYFMRHGKAEGMEMEIPLTKEAIQKMQEPTFISNVLRINPDIIYASPSVRSMQTADEVAKIMKIYRDKNIEIKKDERLRS